MIGDYDFAYKVDAAAPNGTYIGADGNAITISNSDGKVFDWSSNPNGIGAVIVKAATGRTWVYDPQVNSDTVSSLMTTRALPCHLLLESGGDL